MTEPIFPRNVVRLQQPPIVHIEARLDGSLTVVPSGDPVGRQTVTRQGTNDGTETSHTTHTSGGTSSETITATGTSGAVRIGTGTVPLILSREVRRHEVIDGGKPIEEVGFEFDQSDFRELVDLGGERVENEFGVSVHSVTLSEISAKQVTVLETMPTPPVTGAILPGVIGQNDSDDDQDGDTDREGDDDSGDDSDNRHDSEPDTDAVGREGRDITVPFDIDRFKRLPFSPHLP
jgi:hypothetical protein